MLDITPDMLQRTVTGRPRDLLKRASIVEAARKIFLKYGYGGSIDTIAAEAGVAKRTLYRNFSSKAALFSAVIETTSSYRLPSTLFDLDEGASIAQVLYEIAMSHADLAGSQESLELYKLMAILEIKSPEKARLFYENVRRTTFNDMTNLLQQANNQGKVDITNVALAAEYFLSAFYGNMQFRKILEIDDTFMRQEYVNEAVCRFVRAYSI
jgi:TetR/AcrR family transcriptional repressor of mexJK operon